ncbi:unnamed protein product, partial [Mesorhabditis belari]|uniref:Uncharacterized protein n=1 Tax=Mesorhabditis belari TaxID=2138241 RepID=A0AAF3FGP6_9BILA
MFFISTSSSLLDWSPYILKNYQKLHNVCYKQNAIAFKRLDTTRVSAHQFDRFATHLYLVTTKCRQKSSAQPLTRTTKRVELQQESSKMTGEDTWTTPKYTHNRPNESLRRAEHAIQPLLSVVVYGLCCIPHKKRSSAGAINQSVEPIQPIASKPAPHDILAATQSLTMEPITDKMQRGGNSDIIEVSREKLWPRKKSRYMIRILRAKAGDRNRLRIVTRPWRIFHRYVEEDEKPTKPMKRKSTGTEEIAG